MSYSEAHHRLVERIAECVRMQERCAAALDGKGASEWRAREIDARAVLIGLLSDMPETPLQVWPGLEREGLETMHRVSRVAFNAVIEAGGTLADAQRAYHTAATAHLFRKLVAALPRVTGKSHYAGWVRCGSYYIPPEALAALADPYDGGGK